MVSQSKPRVIKDFDKLDPEIVEQIKLTYPLGFSDYLISFTNKDGKFVSALPFETDEKYYLVRMTVVEAERIIEEDSDYDVDGNLKDSIKEEYESKHPDIEYVPDILDEPTDDDVDDD
ncbi:MAG: hypothetical protein K9H64_03100 [Bacteroidales bacterium]|nr:hypothetical protein [Bacteroidales bacterium]MCF8454470.1 hypothetical protein [Bacteroidales bacterium]